MASTGTLRLAIAVCASVAFLAVLMQAAPSSAATAANWTQYGHDAQRSSVGDDQTPFKSISLDWSKSVDAAAFAQPLVWNGRVYVATENNSVYAFDGLTGALDWHTNLGTPATSAEVGGTTCSNLGPTVGITGTPAIDPATGRLYAVGLVHSSSLLSTLHYELWTVDANTGAHIGTGRVIDPWFKGGVGNHTSTQTRVQQQRGAVLLANDTVYVTFGGQVKQCGAFYGWIAGISVSTGAEFSFQVPALPLGGSMWSPGGPSVDTATGDIWVASSEPGCGSNCQTSTLDLTDSVLKFSAGLGLLDSFTPPNVVSLNDSDLDLGSFTPAHLGNGVVFAIGKGGTGYLLSASNMGHTYPGPIPPPNKALFTNQVCETPNTLAHTAAAWSPPNLYVPCQEGIRRLVVNTASAPPSFTIAARGPVNGHLTGSTVLAYGAVWNVNPVITNFSTFVPTSADLYAMNPQSLVQMGGTPIELKSTSGAVLLPTHFPSPSAGLGHIYVATNGAISAYSMGLVANRPTSTPTPIPTPTSTPVAGASVTLNPIADTYTSRSAPTSTAGGSSTFLRADVTGSDTAFLRFDLSGLAGKTVKGAHLRIHTTTLSFAGSAVTFNIRFVNDDTWKEQFMSFNNTVSPFSIAPVPIGTVQGPAPNTFYTSSELDLKTVQAQVGTLFSMAVNAPQADVLIFDSREAGTATAPQLVLTLQ
jgi:hypothetical protein